MEADKKEVLTVKNIRNVNTENIIYSIIRNKYTTRSVLAKENGISLMTVKHVVDDLIAIGLLVEKESMNAEVGRNPKVLALAEPYGIIICVNLTSEDEIGYVIYDVHQNLLKEECIVLQGEKAYQIELLQVLRKVKESVHTRGKEIVGVAAFVPSAYDSENDQINYDLIPSFKGLHVKGMFEQEFQVNNVLVLHDVFAAARSEYDSSSPKTESQFYFYCGYGVGGFFIHQDEAVRGIKSMAGEVGKMLISMDGQVKNFQTLEESVSISGVKRQMQEAGMSRSFAELLRLFEAADVQAMEVLVPVLYTVSKVLYNLLWVYNPTRVVIDSSSTEYSKVIVAHFKAFIEEMKDEAIPMETEVRQAKYNEYHQMQGCFQMARNAWVASCY